MIKETDVIVVQVYGGYSASYIDYSGMYPVSISISGKSPQSAVEKVLKVVNEIGIDDLIEPIPEIPIENKDAE